MTRQEKRQARKTNQRKLQAVSKLEDALKYRWALWFRFNKQFADVQAIDALDEHYGEAASSGGKLHCWEEIEFDSDQHMSSSIHTAHDGIYPKAIAQARSVFGDSWEVA
tara:strand:+ start:513 stop:839 length:327 start_codon:yes stop_codon:yes gene_type:complete